MKNLENYYGSLKDLVDSFAKTHTSETEKQMK
jgi:hypothetical protein